MLQSGASSLQISAISTKSCRSSLCLLFFSFCLQRLLCNAFQNKENLFLPICVVFLGRPARSRVFFFLYFFLRCVVSWLMLFGCCELWTESQKLTLENLLFKQCSTTFLERIAWLVRCSFIFYFLWSLPTLGHQEERV
jgi:hypothetical protein